MHFGSAGIGNFCYGSSPSDAASSSLSVRAWNADKPFERVWRGEPKINTLVVLSGPALKMAAGPELSTGLNLYISHGGGAVGDFGEAMMTEHFGRFWIALRDYV